MDILSVMIHTHTPTHTHQHVQINVLTHTEMTVQMDKLLPCKTSCSSGSVYSCESSPALSRGGSRSAREVPAQWGGSRTAVVSPT